MQQIEEYKERPGEADGPPAPKAAEELPAPGAAEGGGAEGPEDESE